MDQKTFVDLFDPSTSFTITRGHFVDHVRETLSGVPYTRPITTADLATLLLGTAELTASRKALYNKLKYYSETDLADCLARGAKVTKKLYGKVTVYRPRLWHKSDGIVRATYCKTCGAELPITQESKES